MNMAVLRRPAVLLAAALLAVPALAQSSVLAYPQPLRLSHPLTDKNFYLFSALDRSNAALQTLAADPGLARIATERHNMLSLAARTCRQDIACEARSFSWTDEEILSVSLVLRRLGDSDSSLRAVVDNDLRPSYAYVLLDKLGPGDTLARAWEICARGTNNMLAVYGQGLAPRYPAIDSISINPQSDEAKQRIAAIISAESSSTASSEPFYAPPLHVALTLLEMNHRDEAARHEPMEEDANKLAISAIAKTNWQSYPYTTIVVPGAGPSDPAIALSESGRKRCALAAEAYRAGKAPFILVSGGYVHPSQTHFSEAIEMRRALIDEFHIPASAILVDPHARHTTTNMRNAAREIFRYGIPSDRPALMISDTAQTAYIANPAMADRCLRELGYVPYRILKKNSDTELAFLPTIESLEQDPMDPLDP
jgi:DUF218 domain